MSKNHPGSKLHRALNSRQWALSKRATHTRDNWLCILCGKRGRLECHHIIRLAEGGDPYDPDNLESLCRSCHIKTHQISRETPEELAWRDFLSATLTV